MNFLDLKSMGEKVWGNQGNLGFSPYFAKSMAKSMGFQVTDVAVAVPVQLELPLAVAVAVPK